MFPDDSCYPISTKYGEESVVSNNDQLVLIIKELAGSLTENDMSFIACDDPREYALHMSRDILAKNQETNLLSKLKGIGKPIIEMIKETLQFNPYFRASAAEVI